MRNAVWIIGILVLVTLVVVAPKDFKDNELPFASQEWKSGDARTRGQMVSSLLKQEEILRGKSISEIRSLLGDANDSGPSYLAYHAKYGFIIEDILPSKNYVIIEFGSVDGIFTKLILADA